MNYIIIYLHKILVSCYIQTTEKVVLISEDGNVKEILHITYTAVTAWNEWQNNKSAKKGV